MEDLLDEPRKQIQGSSGNPARRLCAGNPPLKRKTLISLIPSLPMLLLHFMIPVCKFMVDGAKNIRLLSECFHYGIFYRYFHKIIYILYFITKTLTLRIRTNKFLINKGGRGAINGYRF